MCAVPLTSFWLGAVCGTLRSEQRTRVPLTTAPMRLCTILLASSLSLAAAGQNRSGPERVDSLWGAWTDVSLPDTARLLALEQFIWEGMLDTDLDSAFVLATLLYDRAATQGLTADMLAGLTLQGIIRAIQGDHAAAIGTYQRVIEVSREAGDVRAEQSAWTNISQSHFAMDQPFNALQCLKRSLELAHKCRDRAAVKHVLHSMAVVNAKMDYLDRSDSLARLSMLIAEELEDARGIFSALMVLGENLIKQGRMAEAEPIYARAQGLEEHASSRERLGLFFGLASIHAARGEVKQAVAIGHEALGWAQAMGDVGSIKEAYGRLYETHRQAGQYAAALEMYQHYVELHDQLLNDENKAALMRQKAQAEFELKETALHAEMEKQEAVAAQRIQQQRTARNGVLAGSLLLLAGGGSWLYADRKRRKERARKEVAELETRVLRSQMNPHFIFNALNSINAYVQRHDAEGASTYLSKFAKLMRAVLENSRHAEVPLQEDLDALRGYIELERQRMEKKFDFTIAVDPAIDPELVMVPPLVVQPLVENAIWHGLANKVGSGHLKLDVRKQGDVLHWTVEDNGVGRRTPAPPGELGARGGGKRTSLGTTLTRSRLGLLQQQYGGRAELRYRDLPEGTRAEVVMPVIMA